MFFRQMFMFKSITLFYLILNQVFSGQLSKEKYLSKLSQYNMYGRLLKLDTGYRVNNEEYHFTGADQTVMDMHKRLNCCYMYRIQHHLHLLKPLLEGEGKSEIKLNTVIRSLSLRDEVRIMLRTTFNYGHCLLTNALWLMYTFAEYIYSIDVKDINDRITYVLEAHEYVHVRLEPCCKVKCDPANDFNDENENKWNADLKSIDNVQHNFTLLEDNRDSIHTQVLNHLLISNFNKHDLNLSLEMLLFKGVADNSSILKHFLEVFGHINDSESLSNKLLEDYSKTKNNALLGEWIQYIGNIQNNMISSESTDNKTKWSGKIIPTVFAYVFNYKMSTYLFKFKRLLRIKENSLEKVFKIFKKTNLKRTTKNIITKNINTVKETLKHIIPNFYDCEIDFSTKFDDSFAISSIKIIKDFVAANDLTEKRVTFYFNNNLLMKDSILTASVFIQYTRKVFSTINLNMVNSFNAFSANAGHNLVDHLLYKHISNEK
ncbi:uncharacterized protein LOC126838555 [Adelges cooleyi]|uniref:uncharacterized protein LOC126838555 n=1 Tax=Adelges cooleyi TaxID=133065 RepID=UPI00217FD587|nr:uncharacterized protein LOC126838555 [Adelges cooleyi]